MTVVEQQTRSVRSRFPDGLRFANKPVLVDVILQAGVDVGAVMPEALPGPPSGPRAGASPIDIDLTWPHYVSALSKIDSILRSPAIEGVCELILSASDDGWEQARDETRKIVRLNRQLTPEDEARIEWIERNIVEYIWSWEWVHREAPAFVPAALGEVFPEDFFSLPRVRETANIFHHVVSQRMAAVDYLEFRQSIQSASAWHLFLEGHPLPAAALLLELGVELVRETNIDNGHVAELSRNIEPLLQEVERVVAQGVWDEVEEARVRADLNVLRNELHLTTEPNLSLVQELAARLGRRLLGATTTEIDQGLEEALEEMLAPLETGETQVVDQPLRSVDGLVAVTDILRPDRTGSGRQTTRWVAQNLGWIPVASAGASVGAFAGLASTSLGAASAAAGPIGAVVGAVATLLSVVWTTK